MLNIEKKQEGNALTVKLDGRLDTNTAPLFQGEVEPLLGNLSKLTLDFEKHNAQYSPIEVKQFDRSHDRWLCIDDTVYLVGASLKDLGKKWFGFTKMEQTTDELLSKM